MNGIEPLSPSNSLEKGTIAPENPSEHDNESGELQEVHTIRTSGHDQEFLHIGSMKVKLSDLISASGGDLWPSIHFPPPRRFGNAAPLGLMAYANITFLVALINIHTRHVTEPNIGIILAYSFGGFAQICAGVWEIACENTFGATTLSGMGAFWIEYGILLTPGFGIAEAYSKYPGQFKNAQGLFLITWAMFSYMLMVCTIRSTIAFFGLFFAAGTTLVLQACYCFTGNIGLLKASGWIGIVTAFFAYFNAMMGLVTYENSYIKTERLKIYMPGAMR